jgi:hypothetical protein
MLVEAQRRTEMDQGGGEGLDPHRRLSPSRPAMRVHVGLPRLCG